MAGTYKSPSMAAITGSINRPGIETGYLNIILHGGLFLLIPYIIILIYSIKNFKFKNRLNIKDACKLYILFHILYLYPIGTPRLGLEYIVLWNIISISLSKTNINNFNIKKTIDA